MERAARIREHRRGHGDAGETLIEILATIMVMSIAFVGIIAGTGASIRLSGTHRVMADTEVVLGVAAEAIKGATPVACGSLTVSSYRATLDAISPNITLPTGWTTAANLSIQAAGTSCNAGSTLKLQTITIVATAPTSGWCPATAPCTDSIAVLKRSSDA